MPSVYERRDVPAAGIVVWGKAEDIDKAMTSNKMSQSSSGFFTLQPSTRVGFDTQTKRFTHEETALAEAKQMPGLVNPKFERVDANGFPIAAFTAEIGERHLYLLYVATGTGAILINYHHADPFTARDAEVWSQFIKGLGSR
jgi:hypothetical protein